MKKLIRVPANDTFAALNLMLDVLDERVAGFITPSEVNGVKPEIEGLPDEVADSVGLIVESSGSTGVPKRIELSPTALRASGEAVLERLGGPGQWLLALPINFIAGANVLIRSVLSDTQPVMLNSRVPFTVEAFVRGASLMDGARRYTSVVPAQLAKLAAAAKQDAFVFSMLRKFDAILVGGQQPNWADVQELKSRGVNVVVSYGMTETGGGCIFDGEPIGGVAYRLSDSLIEISGPTLAEGYGPWFKTNDIGEVENDKLKVIGRSDRVIISGGVKVSLDRIEQAALEIPGVAELVAIALPTEWGESVGIVYSGSPEVDFGPIEQISVAAKVRESIRVSEIPRLLSGKPDLLACRALLAD